MLYISDVLLVHMHFLIPSAAMSDLALCRASVAAGYHELFKLLSGISGGWCGGAIPLMVAIIIISCSGCRTTYPMW